MAEKLYSTVEVAKLLNVDSSRIRQIARGTKPRLGRKVGRPYVFTEKDVERLKARRTTPGFPLPKKD